MAHSIEADMHAGVVRVAADMLLWAVEDMYTEPPSWASVFDTAMPPGVGMKLPEGIAVLGKVAGPDGQRRCWVGRAEGVGWAYPAEAVTGEEVVELPHFGIVVALTVRCIRYIADMTVD
jgi:hypothetical protein